MLTNETRSLSVAETILEQLGGSRFLVMTGARSLVSDRFSLRFKLPARFALDGINCVIITLSILDTYEIEFLRVTRNGMSAARVGEFHSNVYADQLRELFERRTGLALSL